MDTNEREIRLIDQLNVIWKEVADYHPGYHIALTAGVISFSCL
jgi:hypothetical protein